MGQEPSILIIGAGGIVRDAHLPAYKIAGFSVKGVFDLDIEKSRNLAKKFQIPRVHYSLKEVIEQADENSVFDLAVPGKEIIPVLKRIPNQSVILIQKPMGEDLKMARQILALCREKKLRAGINFQLRYAPFIKRAKQLISENRLGEICDIEINVNVFTPWHLWDFLKSLPRVEILYHSIHYVDLVRSFLGNPEGVYAKTIKHPASKELASVRSNIIMDYGEYIRANILTNHNHGYAEKYQRSFIKIEGTKGAIRIEIGVLKNYPEGKDDKFEFISFGDSKGWCEEDIPGTWFPHAFIGSMQEMIKVRKEPNYVPDNSVEDCVHTMEVVEAAYISSANGGISPNSL